MARITSLIILAFLMFGQSGCQSTHTGPSTPSYYYGEKFPNSGGVWRIDELKGGEEFVIVEGTVTGVCQTMGCWLVLRDDQGKELFVQMKDHSFFVPRNAAGHAARAWGRAEKEVVSVDALKHFAADANKSPAEIEAITQPVERITFYARSVVIHGEGLDAAEPPR